MLWRGGRRSENIEDRRGGGGFPSGMRGMRFPVGGRAGGVGGIGLVALVLLGLFFGVDPSIILDSGGGPAPSYERSAPDLRTGQPTGVPDEKSDFLAVVLADTEDTWHALFGQMGRTYREPTLVLFSGMVDSGCGLAQSASGPFYCPSNGKLYLDTSFFQEMSRRFGAPGDFAQAYVIAHEVGHHVQNLLGILPRVQAAQQQAGRTGANRMQVLVELQADCYAGIWAHYANRSRNISLESGDIEEGLNAAAAIGDDRLQKRAQGYVVPDAFTHGSSAQRVGWFKRGLEQGTLQACDTFSAQ